MKSEECKGQLCIYFTLCIVVMFLYIKLLHKFDLKIE